MLLLCKFSVNIRQIQGKYWASIGQILYIQDLYKIWKLMYKCNKWLFQLFGSYIINNMTILESGFETKKLPHPSYKLGSLYYQF